MIILVSADRDRLRRAQALLSEAGYSVVPASSFDAARTLLRSVTPDLLVADVELGAFNGLHLVVHGQLHHPHLPAIITHRTADSVLEAEARRIGACFVADPLRNPEFLGRVRTAIGAEKEEGGHVRQWERRTAPETVEALVDDMEAHVFDVSYGGLRLALTQNRRLPSELDIVVPAAGISVRAHPVWTRPALRAGEYWCGVKLAPGARSDKWHEFVDSFSRPRLPHRGR